MNPTNTRPPRGSAQRRAQLRAQTEARVQEQRQQPLPPWLATRTARRTLALLPVATFGLGVLAATAGGGTNTALLGAATSVVGSSGIGALRRATRMLDRAPENLLDEREISDRDHAYRRGFHLTLVLLGLVAVLAALNSFLAQEAGLQLFESVGWMVLTFASFLTTTMLPAAALAWNWRAPVDEADDLGE
ncbi:hypothetical protein [Kineococcus rhizosphaerae]|uniref:Uncharacterized protein n=1 Tax=Kineococcus rhizosphaerae TaxID=559628 RepID=A0A2T0R091_9ACTN|nr:hypothetical protein [Kineococcus rhizosphaerae]PRY12478.1 hypothetical protein CLV37_11038 [Kineococcus rhizosphaerae]